jgi:hypothetical protein
MDTTSLYCHLFLSNGKGIFHTFKTSLPNFDKMHILDFKNIVEKEFENLRKKDNNTNTYSIEYISKTIYSHSITDSIKLSVFFNHRDDIYCCVSIIEIFILFRANTKTSY